MIMITEKLSSKEDNFALEKNRGLPEKSSSKRVFSEESLTT